MNLDNAAGWPLLTVMMLIPFAGIAVILCLKDDRMIRWATLFTMLAVAGASVPLYLLFDRKNPALQFVDSYRWLPDWNLDFSLGVDGISLPLIFLSTLVGIMAVLAAWRSVAVRIKAFHVNLLVMSTIMTGLFASVSLFVFFIFWEAMLIPVFLLIGIWGGPKRMRAAVKFLLFTFGGSIFMLVGIIALYFLGPNTFDIRTLSALSLPAQTQFWLFLAFTLAFAVKVPMIPFHSWLPDAYTEAPTAVTVILSAVLAKMGTYGLLRIPVPLFPDAARDLAGPLLLLSAATIVYGAYVALVQKDFKRLIAYSSMSHMGFITLGIFALNGPGMGGAVLQMVNHGIVTGALFLCAGILFDRTRSEGIDVYGNLAVKVPVFTVCFTLFGLAGTGFPGLNYFNGEFLVLSGAFRASIPYASLAIPGVVLGVTYTGWLYYRVILRKHGEFADRILPDLDTRETLMLAPLVLLVFLIGVDPQLFLGIIDPPVRTIIERIDPGALLAIRP